MFSGLAGEMPDAQRSRTRRPCGALVTLQVIPKASVDWIHTGESSRQVFGKKMTGRGLGVARRAGLFGKSAPGGGVVTSELVV
jgi:hypothetical protein